MSISLFQLKLLLSTISAYYCQFIVVSLIVYFVVVVVVVCQNRQVNGPNKCKHEISDSALFYLFILFCYTKLRTDPHVNKNFCSNFLAKAVSVSCSKLEATNV